MPDKTEETKQGKMVSVYVSFVQEGSLESAAFCRKEAEEAGLFDEHVYDLLGCLGKTEEKGLEPVEVGLFCPACGLSREDFEEHGRLGCPQCYDAFGSAIVPLLRKLHLGGGHLGKIPRRALIDRAVNDRIRRLKVRMEKAVSMERYEDAARFRNEIKKIKDLV